MIQKVLGWLGKTEGKVVAVFAVTAGSAARSAQYLRKELDLPLWLFCCATPPAEIAALFDEVVVERSPLRLWGRSQRMLWKHQVALAVADWDGKPGNWPVKLAPLTIPFFRALFRNGSGQYFAGAPGPLRSYAVWAIRKQSRDARIRSKEWAVGSVLWVFAFIAQWNSGVSRVVYRRLKGSRSLALKPNPPGQGVAVYRYQGRSWIHQEIRELMQNSGARFLLFQEQSEPEEQHLADLISCFSDPATFVVSRQYAVRGWRKWLFATAPFRALAAGEKARVHAPVSPVMLVDVAKLQALGLPTLSSYGSNWYVLFHRAAAAGWNSYSIKGALQPKELAAVPFEEADFVKTLLAEPKLRDLTSPSPSLARGNIVQSIAPGPGFRALPRVLIVSPYLPFPLSHGGAVRIWNLCRSLSDRVDFVLACFREKNEDVQYAKLYEVFRDVYVIDNDEKHSNPALPTQVNGYELSSMRQLIASLCQDLSIDLLQLEYTQMAAYREAAPHLPAVLVEHDLTFMLYRQLKHCEYALWLQFERERLRVFDGVWTMSELDREEAVRQGSPEPRTFAIPNGVDLQRFHCPEAEPASQQILYVGSFRHLPNYLAFEELRTRIMPAVWQQFPLATLTVVAGPKHTDHWPGSRELDSRVTVHGFVEDLVPLYSSAAVVTVPLPVSAGTNIKLMEALSCERPVVTTPVGCAGLQLQDGRDVLIRELGEPFVQAICDLLDRRDLRQRIAAAGLRQAHDRFGWEAIADAAYESYCSISSSFPLSRQGRRPRYRQR